MGPVLQRTEPGAYVAGLAWPEVAERVSAGAMGVLPVGAACKEHGPHLPMNTDQIQAEWFAQHLVQKRNVLVWPTVIYGSYPVFVDYPGSCSLEEDTFSRSVYEILHCIRYSGVLKIIIINTGISTISPLQAALGRLPQDVHVLLFNAYSGLHFKRARGEVEEQSGGTHADEIETSILLAIAPQRVAMDKAGGGLLHKQPGPLNRRDPQKPNYSPSGVIGDARLASVEKGKKLVEAILADLNELINASFPWKEEAETE